MLLDKLRLSTQSRHAVLERELALTSPTLSRERMKTVLERFFGFAVVWEEAVATALADERFFGPRRKLHLLRKDLEAFGLSSDQVAALPRCGAAKGLAADPDAAMGSLYVLEGATLGGKFIDRHLRSLAAMPVPALTFFNPYGSLTGAMWMAFCVRATTRSSQRRDLEMICAAVDTFDVVHQWLRPAFARNHRATA